MRTPTDDITIPRAIRSAFIAALSLAAILTVGLWAWTSASGRGIVLAAYTFRDDQPARRDILGWLSPTGDCATPLDPGVVQVGDGGLYLGAGDGNLSLFYERVVDSARRRKIIADLDRTLVGRVHAAYQLHTGDSYIMYVLPVPLWFAAALLALYPTLRFATGPLTAWLRRREGRCTQCGYDLTGNLTGACPECGQRFQCPDRR